MSDTLIPDEPQHDELEPTTDGPLTSTHRSTHRTRRRRRDRRAVRRARRQQDRHRRTGQLVPDRQAGAHVDRRVTLDGKSFKLSERKGSWVVLNFFDPDCIPCQREHADLIALQQQQSQILDGAELYTIINQGSDDAVRAWFTDNGGDWPIVSDPTGSISTAFGVAQVPETWIVDPNGIVRARYAGMVTAEGVGSLLQQMREGTA